MSSNLNNRVEHVQATEVYDTGGVRVFFDNIESVVCDAIEQAEEVVACVAWIKSRPILAALQSRKHAYCHQRPCASIKQSCLDARAASHWIQSREHSWIEEGQTSMHNKFIVLLRNQRHIQSSRVLTTLLLTQR